MNSFIGKAQRKADSDIYLKENRYSTPKEYFKFFVEILKRENPNFKSLTDVGCATGELMYYLNQSFNHKIKFSGIDFNNDLLNKLKEKIPHCTTKLLNLDKDDFSVLSKSDIVTCFGVFTCIFNIEYAIKNLIKILSDNGTIYIFNNFNEDPVDVQVIYNRIHYKSGWETGKNSYSMESIENVFKLLNFGVKWYHFKMPFSIPKTDDPMRSWTEEFRGNKYHLFAGSGQIINLKLLKAYRL